MRLSPEFTDLAGTYLVAVVFVVIAAKIFVPMARQNAWRHALDSWMGLLSRARPRDRA